MERQKGKKERKGGMEGGKTKKDGRREREGRQIDINLRRLTGGK